MCVCVCAIGGGWTTEREKKMELKQQQFNKHFDKKGTLTISIFQRLLFLGRLGDDLDALAVEDSDVLPSPVEHLH